MSGWTPIYQKITQSSVWDLPDHVRLAWISILVTTEKNGLCPTKTAKGLAYLARIDIEQAKDAIKVLSSPDDSSPGQDFEGRRIEVTPEGIMVLNWMKYRAHAKAAAVEESNRIAREKYRNKNKSSDQNDDTEQNVSWNGRPLP